MVESMRQEQYVSINTAQWTIKDSRAKKHRRSTGCLELLGLSEALLGRVLAYKVLPFQDFRLGNSPETSGIFLQDVNNLSERS
jgi:hypothetical protein